MTDLLAPSRPPMLPTGGRNTGDSADADAWHAGATSGSESETGQGTREGGAGTGYPSTIPRSLRASALHGSAPGVKHLSHISASDEASLELERAAAAAALGRKRRRSGSAEVLRGAGALARSSIGSATAGIPPRSTAPSDRTKWARVSSSGEHIKAGAGTTSGEGEGEKEEEVEVEVRRGAVSETACASGVPGPGFPQTHARGSDRSCSSRGGAGPTSTRNSESESESESKNEDGESKLRRLLDEASPVRSERVPDAILVANRYLYREVGFCPPPHEQYYEDRNSIASECLRNKGGLPIAMCLLYRAICSRAGMRGLRCVGMPAHFMLRYDPPAGTIGGMPQECSLAKGWWKGLVPALGSGSGRGSGSGSGAADSQGTMTQGDMRRDERPSEDQVLTGSWSGSGALHAGAGGRRVVERRRHRHPHDSREVRRMVG